MTPNAPPPVRQMVREAAEALDPPFTKASIRQWVETRYPGTNPGTVNAQVDLSTVNQPSRTHYPENRRPRVAADPRYDFLFAPGTDCRVLYDPERHGTWRIAKSATGDLIVCCDGDVPAIVEPDGALGVPLVRSQIDAANHLKERCPGWAGSEAGFDKLHSKMPGFDLPIALIKAAAINNLYSTNVYAIWRMGQHLANIRKTLPRDPAAAVREIASLSSGKEAKGPTHWSFASKVAHFFIDPDRFPIYDSYCAAMVVWHLGKGERISDPSDPFAAFKANIDKLRARCGFAVTYRELDRYLWLAGQYREWRKKDGQAQINTELRALFENPSPGVREDLSALLPN